MTDYFTAYRARLERNDQTLRTRAEELKALGCTVLAPRRTQDPNSTVVERRLEFIRVRKDGKECIFGFAEVPYRWYIDVSWKPNTQTGSGKTVKTQGPEDPFTAKEIMEQMIPTEIDKRFEFVYKEL